MPKISEFFGILIFMYYNDHAPPHFHARYAEQALIRISPLGILEGSLPPRAFSLVMEWAQIHQDQLMEDWSYAATNKKLHKIPPLE